ncbi:MAG TPA: amidohydrolase, partial [Mycobacteriales bacterium]|nr:amidohydrolase [Mycobacteriales bacterium]
MPWLETWLQEHGPGLITFRRELHQNPELAYAEHRTTSRLAETLAAVGLQPHLLPSGTGVFCDIGTGDRVVALRADIDALPLQDVKQVPYASAVAGVCHACGHDAHTTIVLGTALALASGPELPGRVRVIFQPAEEAVPGGALDAIEGGALEGVERIFALHCDPKLETGKVGLRTGPITAACDKVDVLLSGPGGHTARPHTTVDLVYALGRVITDVPGLLSRRADPRHGMSLVWGAVQAGIAANTIPQEGRITGTVRMLDRAAWENAAELVRTLIEQVAEPTGAKVEVTYGQGVPPVDNDPASTAILHSAVQAALGPKAVADTEQSLGGEDFAWYLGRVPGALARLGVRPPDATGPNLDLHQPTFDIDEAALSVGV